MLSLLAFATVAVAGPSGFELRVLGEGAVDTTAEALPRDTTSTPSPGAGEEVAELRLEVFTRAHTTLAEGLSLTLSGFAGLWTSQAGPVSDVPYRPWNGTRGSSGVDERLVEMSANLSRGTYSVRVGKQIIRWGATTFLSPVDVVAPVDLRRGPLVSRSADRNAPYLGVWAVRALVERSPALFEFVWVPIFTADRLSLVSGDWAIIDVAGSRGLSQALQRLRQVLPPEVYDRLGTESITPATPRTGRQAGQLGGRVSLRGESAQVAMQYFTGYEAYPALTVNTALANQILTYYEKDPALRDPRTDFDDLLQRLAEGEALVTGEYRRRQTLGASGEISLGSVRLSADLAWSPRVTVYTRSGRPADAWMTAGVLSTEYVPSERLAITAGFHATSFSLKGPTAELLFGWTARQLIASLGLQGLLAERWRLQVLALGEVDRYSWFGSASVGYRIANDFETYLAVDLIEGGPQSIGGRFDHNDQLALGFRANY